MSSSFKPTDEFDATRIVVEVLKNFSVEDQARIVRWAQEKLGFAGGTNSAVPGITMPGLTVPGVGSVTADGKVVVSTRAAGNDISTFVQKKNPSNDVQFATAVAYYYAFDSPATTRKAEITATDLQEATRLSSHERLNDPLKTLHNTVARGYLDKGSTRGTFKINTVGENLVAMSLPTGPAQKSAPRRTRPARKK